MLTSGTGPAWSAELHIKYDSSLARARETGVPYGAPGDAERFRRKYGENHKLWRVVPTGTGGSVPWDRGWVEIFTTPFFILHEPSGFWGGEPAYPDTIELIAPELPAGLRGTAVANKYGQAWS